jgi:hypothetical protein
MQMKEFMNTCVPTCVATTKQRTKTLWLHRSKIVSSLKEARTRGNKQKIMQLTSKLLNSIQKGGESRKTSTKLRSERQHWWLREHEGIGSEK